MKGSIIARLKSKPGILNAAKPKRYPSSPNAWAIEPPYFELALSANPGNMIWRLVATEFSP
jgi:hypothetical protein